MTYCFFANSLLYLYQMIHHLFFLFNIRFISINDFHEFILNLESFFATMTPYSLPRINNFWANSVLFNYFSCESTISFAIILYISRTFSCFCSLEKYLWIHYLFRELTIFATMFSGIYHETTNFFAISLWIYYFFCESTLNQLFFSLWI